MTDPMNATPDISPIRALIRKTVLLLRSSWVATGMGITLGLGLGTLAAVTLLDLAMPQESGLRLAALVMVVVPASWAFVMGVIRPLARRMRPAHVARRIEKHIPNIHNRLVSCIDLDTAAKKSQYSPEFYRRLVNEALDKIRGFRATKVVDARSLGRASLFAGASVLAFGLAFGLLSDRMPTALARIFSPFADIPPASGVIYTVEPGDAKILRGEDVTFIAKVEKGDPDKLQLEIRPDANKDKDKDKKKAGAVLRYDLTKVGPQQWRFVLTGFESSFEYRVRGGGTWTKRKRITMVERPTILALNTLLHYPEYMGVLEPRVGPPQVADVTGPESSTVEVVVRAGGHVAEGDIQILASRPIQVPVADRPERIWFQERLPEGAGGEGRWDWDFRLLGKPTHTEPPAAGVHGHRFANAKTPFAVRSGENLFAMVYIKPDQKPDAIMLSWLDDKDWEHRAFWGVDKFTEGKLGTASRKHMGPLPSAGEWVRLEVPASAVELEGKSIKGMGFTLFGGQCQWHKAGSVPPSHLEKQELYVAEKFPIGSAGEGKWSGKFPITGNTLYRVELRNEMGHPSKPMKPGKVVAIPDNPPQVVLERPGADLVLNTPVKVPLSISAYDDFGLSDIVVSVQRGDSGGFVGRPVKRYERPQRSESVLASLDIPVMNLKTGEHVRYRVEARDRKGQSAQTQEYVVRIAADNNAADKQVENFDKGQDTFRENLVKLIAEQAKVEAAVKAMAAKYAPLEEKVKAAQAEQRPAPEKAADKPNEPAKAAEPPKLDPELAKQLDELRKELAQAAAQEEQNAKLGEQVAAGLKQAAEQAANLKMLPSEMVQQMKGVEQAFENRALQPLQDLAAEMKQGADAKQPDAPDLAQMEREAERLAKELDAVKDQLDAASKARKDLPQDAEAAVDALNKDMLRENADLTARDLEDLKDFLKAREEELKKLEGQQAELAGATPAAPEMLLPDVEKRQGELDPKEDKALADAQALLDAEKLRRLRKDDPDFPAAPFKPEGGEEMVPPKEEDPGEPAAENKADDAAKPDGGEAEKKDQAEDEPLFLPALGGPKPKLDPRFADKRRPVLPNKGEEGDKLDARREALLDHQQERLAELDAAIQALASDEHSLDDLLNQLNDALHAENPDEAQPLLDQLMKNPAMAQAMAMARRGRQVANARSKSQGKPGKPMPGVSTPNPDKMPTTDQVGSPLAAKLAELDPATRTLILKMQPQMREELLQGLREEGPEGYKTFIRDYFKRLTQVKGAP